ncbi:hypothetical protein ACFLQL_02650 [Verrucomicrobiota bacterium]
MCLLVCSFPCFAGAASNSLNQSVSPASAGSAETTSSGDEKFSAQWGGHIKVRGNTAWPGAKSYIRPDGASPFYDGNSVFRLKNKLLFEDWAYFETHYVAAIVGGEIWRKIKKMEEQYPASFDDRIIPGQTRDDSGRLMNLTWVLEENDDFIVYNYLDRFCLTLLPEYGVIRVGRQAVTWGNGLLFNPMDLFNPFSPSQIDRDYKIGDDMLFTQFPAAWLGNFQLLYVPRRNPSYDKVEWDQSSVAGKLHFAEGDTEFDVMAAKHYGDVVTGLGSCGYLLDAAWRLDGTWTFLNQDKGADGYLALVANIDYSWVWWEKNFYGFLEFYYNGLCNNDYSAEYADQAIVDRLVRGEMFTMGRDYLSGNIRAEVHPLLNIYLTVINNLADPSGILQPRAVWDVVQNLQMTLGGNIYYGREGTEYGGFPIPGTDLLNQPADNVFLWLAYYF